MAKFKAHGFALYKGGVLANKVINLITINPSGATTEQIDVTDHESPAGSAEFIGGIVNQGTFDCEMHWDPTNAVHQAIIADLESGIADDYQLHFPPQIVGVAPWEFNATVSGFGPGMNAKEALKGTITFQVSGNIDRDATPWV